MCGHILSPMQDAEPTKRFQLFVPTAPHTLSVIAFSGSEEISKSYRFSIAAFGPQLDAAALEEAYVGRAAHFCFERDTASERWLHGVIHRMRARTLRADSGVTRYYDIELVPQLRLLGHKTCSRVFQDMSVPEIVTTVLAGAGIEPDAFLSRTYARRSYVVQHQESDKHFVERLLAEEGIFYFFDHPQEQTGTERMVLADAAAALTPIAGSDRLRVREDTGMATSDDRDVHSFTLEKRTKAGRLLIKDYDLARPSFELRGDARWTKERIVGGISESPAASADGIQPDAIERYTHHGDLETSQVDEGAAIRRLEQHRRKAWVATGATKNGRLVPGHTVTVDDVQIDGHPVTYTIYRVEHVGRDPISHADDTQGPTYKNRFEAVPADVPFRPRPSPPRVQQVLESATVVGPAGEEIFTDELGRIKVQFHWDREGKRDDHSSCWIRVMQASAGVGWGFQFIPRVGMEVMVAFLAGDTDRPVVLGCVYNAEHPPSFPLPAEKTKSGIRTKSTPYGDGFNEISFEDAAGHENIFVHAERHLTQEIRDTHRVNVGNDYRLKVGGNAHAAVTGDASTVTLGSHREQVEKDRTLSVAGESRARTRGNSSSVVNGNSFSTTAGDAHALFSGSLTTRVRSKAAVSVDRGLSVDVGAEGAAPASIHGHGSIVASAESELVLIGNAGIRLVCGSSSIRLLPDKIELTADAITIKASDTATVRGSDSILELAGEARVAAKATRLFGSAASLDLSTDAFLKGGMVRLNAREGDPPKAVDSDAQVETQSLKLRLRDRTQKGYAARPCDVTVDGTRYSTTTDGDGNISVTIPKSATEAHVLLWVGDPPSGERREWTLALGSLEPATSLAGARSRLTALGFRVGAGDELDPTTANAICDFQEQHDLQPSGEVDAATASELTAVHGH